MSALDGAGLAAEAERAAHACDLEAGLPARGPDLAAALVALFTEGDVAALSPRALWNLLWLAGDLTTHVDVYRAAALLAAVERLFARHFAVALDGPGPATEAAEMCFDFFFNRDQQPLASLRLPEVLATLGRILALPNRWCRRAALHGLGHLVAHTPPERRVAVEAVLDAFLASEPDSPLGDYARAARAGDLL